MVTTKHGCWGACKSDSRTGCPQGVHCIRFGNGFPKPDKGRENCLRWVKNTQYMGSRNCRNEVILNCTHNLFFREKILDTRSLVISHHMHHCGGSNENP